MNGNRRWLLPLLALLLPLTASAELQRSEGEKAVLALRGALEQGQFDVLQALLSEQAPVHLQVQVGDQAPQAFTLSGARFLQQLRALQRFATRREWQFSRPTFSNGADGRLTVQIQVEESRTLFGTTDQQWDDLTLILARVDGQVRIVELHNQTRLP